MGPCEPFPTGREIIGSQVYAPPPSAEDIDAKPLLDHRGNQLLDDEGRPIYGD